MTSLPIALGHDRVIITQGKIKVKRNKMIETKLKGKQSEDAKWRRKETSNDARKNKQRMTQCSQIQLINTKHIGAGP